MRTKIETFKDRTCAVLGCILVFYIYPVVWLLSGRDVSFVEYLEALIKFWEGDKE